MTYHYLMTLCLDDRETYQDLCKALDTVGFSKRDQRDMMSVACALLYTSNIDFRETAGSEGSELVPSPSLQSALTLRILYHWDNDKGSLSSAAYFNNFGAAMIESLFAFRVPDLPNKSMSAILPSLHLLRYSRSDLMTSLERPSNLQRTGWQISADLRILSCKDIGCNAMEILGIGTSTSSSVQALHSRNVALVLCVFSFKAFSGIQSSSMQMCILSWCDGDREITALSRPERITSGRKNRYSGVETDCFDYGCHFAKGKSLVFERVPSKIHH